MIKSSFLRRNLQKTLSDRGLLRHMTGEWFYETKQLRHRDRIHGTDIIRASIKQAPRPLATRESLIRLALQSERGAQKLNTVTNIKVAIKRILR